MEKKVISTLQELGLTPNEALLFKYLMENGGSSTLDMNKYLKIRQPQLYDLLSSLERKGMINVIEGRPKIYETVSIEVILKQIQKDLEENRKLLTRWEEISGSKERTAPAIWVSRSWRSFRNNTMSLINEAKKTLMIQSPLSFLPDLMDEMDLLDLKQQRVLLLLYGNGIEERELKAITDKRYFSDVGILDLGKFFAIVEDDGNSSFMPRNIMEKERSQRYGYIFRDKDMTWFIIHNFFMGWFESGIVKRKKPEVGTIYTNQRVALYDVAYLVKEQKKEVWMKISGYDKKRGRDVTLEGYVESVVTTNNIFNFTVVSKSGESYSIGGFDSKGERVEAEKIELVDIR